MLIWLFFLAPAAGGTTDALEVSVGAGATGSTGGAGASTGGGAGASGAGAGAGASVGGVCVGGLFWGSMIKTSLFMLILF
jgi:hypothetical protein